MPFKHKILTTALSVFCATLSVAQDSDTLALPFFDDFSYNGTEPDNSLWQNNGVTLSNTLPNRPPSIGVAVFDALNIDGEFYPSQYGTKYASGDTLTSKPIDLYYPGDNTIFLSFFYQPGGFGDAPENEDELMLDFYSPEDDEWTNVLTIPGAACHTFKQAVVPINQKAYLQKGFRFRFRNYFSLGSPKQADLVTNCDFWLVDYIKLDKLRSAIDTVYQDVALTNCPEIKFNQYMTIPWKHYSKAVDKVKLSYSVYYRNNDNQPRMLDSINLILKNKDCNDTLMLGSYNLPSYWDFSETKQFPYKFKSDAEKVEYQIGLRLVSDVSQHDFAQNNTYFDTKTLDDYYAYDDGSAEAGYGIQGEGSTGSMVAVKFAPLIKDNIKGVYIYFNPTFNDAQADFFHLKIWNCEHGLPAQELYSADNLSLPKNECGSFVFFPLQKSVSVSDTFFIGWQKTQNEILNVGFDKSTTGVAVNYYNINGQWKLSDSKGQIMIRPAFGGLSTANDDLIVDIQQNNSLCISPNPAKDRIWISGLDTDIDDTLYIVSVTGKTVKTLSSSANNSYDISDLADGVYFIKIGNLSAKFIKIR